ncbi:TylF/MycF/NovP-related O-methyltransferase [Campylobacter troglodytis]|uniref:TylF/MycF/NovP-related O-methyltransferase n=1 Tax=Campylobacter troglodytis TaxID=654363 RepID=UPI00115BB71E|nr:TylF/MycF/NovP-related O-methyltransferase [Campylobacter troglodytis]
MNFYKKFTQNSTKRKDKMQEKKKALIYGLGRRGRQIAELICFDYELLGFVDELYKESQITINKQVYRVFNSNDEALLNLDFDKVFVGLFEMQEGVDNLQKLGVKPEKIDTSLGHFDARVDFIRSLSIHFQKYRIKGSVAELGVFQGDFARFINKFFSSKCYLIDTFSGFDDRDVQKEGQEGCVDFIEGEFTNTSIDLVRSKLSRPERVQFIKGYFPQDVLGKIPNEEQFCFVNLDMDLKEPILAGLEYFYPRLVGGGGG